MQKLAHHDIPYFFLSYRANVIATDLPEVIPHLMNNLDTNQEAVTNGEGKITAIELDWTRGNSSLSSPDFLLLADCVYYEKVEANIRAFDLKFKLSINF